MTPTDIVCKGCGTTFTPPRKHRGGGTPEYCTDPCKQKAQRRARRNNITEQLAHTLGDIRDQHWRRHSACHGTDPNLWFPNPGDRRGVATAKAICHQCPVRADCLNDNLYEPDGIYGATTGDERKALRGWKQRNQGVAS